MRTLAAGLLAAAAILAAGPAAAKDGWKDLLAEAKAKARASENGKASALFGEALALAQKQGDLLAEQEAFDAFREFLERLPGPPKEGGREVESIAGGSREALAAVLSKLDPKRCGAFVSAPCLAGDLLVLAVEKGDGRFVEQAAAALAPHAKGGKSGLGLATLAKLGAALKARTPGEDPAAADAPLEEAFAAAVQENWTDLAMAAGVELAARAAARPGEAAPAKAAVERLARLLAPETDLRLCTWLRSMVDVRLKGAPEEVLKPFADAFAARVGGSASSAGGRGGRGGEGADSAAPVSPLGEALRKAPRGSPLGTVARAKGGFEFRVAWDAKFRGVHQHQDGVKHLDEGGLTVSFLAWSVAMRMADPEGTRGQPGESSRPEEGRAFYRLARGETWALSKEGIVSIGK